MEKKGENQNQGSVKSAERTGSLGASQVFGLINSYREISKEDVSRRHQLHFTAMQNVLETAVSTYTAAMKEAKTRPHTSEYRLREINSNFERVVEGARKINFPDPVLAKLSRDFINHSLDYDAPRSPFERAAAAKIGLAIGGTKLQEVKAQQIVLHETSAIKEVLKKDRGDSQVHRTQQVNKIQQADKMIGELNLTVELQQIPSVVEMVTELAREHGRGIATTGAVALLAASIIAPTVANAAPSGENATPVVSLTQNSKSTGIEASPTLSASNIDTSVSVALPTKEKTAQPEAISVSSTASQVAESPVSVAISTSTEQKDAKAPSAVSIQMTPTTPQIAVSVTTVAQKTENAPTTVTAPVESIAQAQPVDATPSVDLTTKVDTGQPLSVEVAPTPHVSNVENNSSNLTPEQKATLAVLNTINNSGDISTASSLIRIAFHDKGETATSFTNGVAVYATTNQDLVTDVHKLEIAVENTIGSKGHTDVNYVNNSLIALAVLDAAANDQTVLQSPDVQNMLVNIKRPADPYQGKLFDQYLAQAKKTLEANDNALLNGVNAQFVPSVETMYAFALMSATSDTDQAKQIQAIKDAETAAAAAKAAAEAAARAGQSNPSQLLQKAINQAAAQFGWSDGQKAILLAAAQQGASPAAVAGLGGNVFAESGFDPGKQEYGSGIGFGYIQESYGRRTAMEQAAAAAGVNVADPNWQSNYIIGESKGREQRDNSNNEWGGFVGMTDPVAAADYWLYNNERAGVPHSQTRENKATEIFNQINGQIQTIQAAEAAAAKAAAEAKALAEAKAKAEAEAQAAANAMQNGPDIYHWLKHNKSNGQLTPDVLAPVTSGNIEYAAGPNDLNSDYYNQIRNNEGASLKLNPEAARQLDKLADAFAAQFHKKLAVGAAYRSLAGQENQKTYWTQQGQPDNAATPGHSFHGWGLAVDLELSGSDEHQWLVQNGPTFGWVWPNKSGEDWHFEYMGAAAQGNSNDRPEPGL
jgi:hypothetical protein